MLAIEQQIEKNKGGGQAIVLTDKQIAQVEALATYLTIEDIAHYLDIATSTFYEIRNRQPEVLGAYKRGVAKARSLVASKLMEYINEKQNTPSKLTAIMFYLKTQAGWSEKSSLEITKEVPTLPQFVFHIVDPKTGVEKPLEEYNEENQISHE